MLISSHQLQLKPFFLAQCTIFTRPTLSPDTPPSLKPFFKRILAPPQLSRPSVSSPTIRRGGRIPLNSIRHFKQITAPTTSSSAASLLRPHQWSVLCSTAVPLTA
ncbi:hypothetical protein [Parasitella parasitica]|uniref:Uncharacterized protein n=1 Tax=Parasitella parasitica TaxID=35722 RepID=A0A0B7NEA5_9FUNG|nr:hypothetical protein [Parasitella parasitica]